MTNRAMRASSVIVSSVVRLDLILARLTPDDQTHLCCGGGTERHRRSGLGFHAPIQRRHDHLGFASLEAAAAVKSRIFR
jgi:hypothetical protein